jgi:hypothetical protein
MRASNNFNKHFNWFQEEKNVRHIRENKRGFQQVFFLPAALGVRPSNGGDMGISLPIARRSRGAYAGFIGDQTLP